MIASVVKEFDHAGRAKKKESEKQNGDRKTKRTAIMTAKTIATQQQTQYNCYPTTQFNAQHNKTNPC